MIRYQYQVLRFQPDKVGEEFMNLGVVAFVPADKQFEGKFLERVQRLSAFFPGGNSTYIRKLVKHVEDGLHELSKKNGHELGFTSPDDLAAITKQLLPGQDSALFFSDVKVGMDVDLRTAMDATYERMVAKYLLEDDRDIHSDKEVWSKIYRSHFEKLHIAHKFTSRSVSTPHELFSFDHAWKNGHLNCLEAVNFGLKHEGSIKDKVHKWFGKLYQLRKASEDLHVYLLSKMPEDPQLQKLIRDTLAEAAAGKVKLDLVEAKDAEKTAKELAAEIEAHG